MAMGVQAISRTKCRRRPSLGGAGPGGLQAGRSAGTLTFISVILWFSRNVTAQPQIMKSPTFSAAPSRLPGCDPAPTITTPIELRVHGRGADSPGYPSMCPAQTPVTPQPFLQRASHRSRSARGTGPLQKKQLSFQRGSLGCRKSRQPRPLLQKLRCSRCPSLPTYLSLKRHTLTCALLRRFGYRETHRSPFTGGERIHLGSRPFLFIPSFPLHYFSVTL